MFGRDTREYKIRDDASSGKSSLGSAGSAGTSGMSGSLGFMGFSGATSEEPRSIGEVDGVVNLAGGLRVRDDNDLWFRFVEIDL